MLVLRRYRNSFRRHLKTCIHAEGGSKTVSQIFSDAKLQVPLYQRSYAWEPQQVEDLLNDIDYVYRRRYGPPNARSVTTAPSDLDSNDTNGNSDIYHSSGPLVLNARGKQDMMGAEWTVYDIIDGQQRDFSW